MDFRKSTFFIAFILSALSLWGCGKDDRNKVIPSYGENAAASVSAPALAKDRYVLYEANPKCFASSASLNAIRNRLDAIKALGTDILWVMPIHPIGTTNSVGSPYCIKDYKAVNPTYGTLADWKQLVNSAHAKGMKVMMDWVANHTAWDHPWVTDHPDWYTQDGSGKIISPAGTNWADVADLNYSNADMRLAMIDAMTYWVTETDVDGFRCDYAHGVPDDFWKQAIPVLEAVKPDIVMLAESDYERLFACGFDIIFCRAFKSALLNLYAGRTKPSAFLEKGYRDNIASVPASGTKLFFITNHDDASENCPVAQFPGEDAALSAFVLAAALDGSSLIYSSQEIAYSQKVNFFTNTVMNWNARSDYSARYEKAMGAIKKISKDGALMTYASDHVIFVGRPGGVVAVNVTSSKAKVAVPAALGLSEKSLTLDAWEFAIFNR
jgi:hypothetical protein